MKRAWSAVVWFLLTFVRPAIPLMIWFFLAVVVAHETLYSVARIHHYWPFGLALLFLPIGVYLHAPRLSVALCYGILTGGYLAWMEFGDDIPQADSVGEIMTKISLLTAAVTLACAFGFYLGQGRRWASAHRFPALTFPRVTMLPPDRTSRVVYLVVLATLYGFIGLCISPFLPIGGPFGNWAAHRDVAHGVYAYRTPLWDFGWEKEWKDAMQKDYGVRLVGRLHGCFGLDGYSATYDQAYNKVQLAAIEARFGLNVVAATRDRILREWHDRPPSDLITR